MSSAPWSERVAAFGVTLSGKNYWLERLFLRHRPRALILDATGEYNGVGDYADNVEDVLVLLHRAIGRERWRIVAALSDDDQRTLCRVLVPELDARQRSPVLPAGGFTVMHSEVDLLAPSSAPQDVRSLWQRGRHVGLDLLVATQRPSGCHPIIRTQSRFLLMCATYDETDLAYLRGGAPRHVVDDVGILEKRWAILWDRDKQQGVRIDPAGRTVAAYSTRPPTAAGAL